MKKIPTIFVRDMSAQPALVTAEVTPGCEWVFAGEGVPTRKFDGMCCLVRDGVLYKRREVRLGKLDPEGFELVDEDPETGKRVGWVKVGDGPEDKYFREPELPFDGTYELVGPKVQGNPEGVDCHAFMRHGACLIESRYDAVSFDGLKTYLADNDIEGIVWHHRDGRMAKIKGKDFGLKRDK